MRQHFEDRRGETDEAEVRKLVAESAAEPEVRRYSKGAERQQAHEWAEAHGR